MELVSFLRIHTDHWPEWITAISTSVLAVGVILALLSLWDAKRTRHGGLTTDLSRRWDERETRDSIIQFSIKGHPTIIALAERLYYAPGAPPPTMPQDMDEFQTFLRWPNLIETIGVLHKQKAISTRVVWQNWGPGIVTGWVVWKQVVERLRELDTQPSTFIYFERLAALMEAQSRKESLRTVRRGARLGRKRGRGLCATRVHLVCPFGCALMDISNVSH